MGKITMHSVSPELTDEEIEELENAEKIPATYDEDCPRMSKEQLQEFHRFDEIVVKISSDHLEKVKSFGNDCHIVLSRLLDMALDDSDMIKKCI